MKGILKFSIKDTCEIAILCALAIVLDTFVKIPLRAAGGSLNISALVLFVISLRHGWFKGFVSGAIVYGLITCLIDGYGFNTYPMEYFLAFGATCFLGIFGRYINNNLNKHGINEVLCYLMVGLCVLLWCIIRFFCASIDSVYLYESTWIGAFEYNALYVFLSGLFDVLILFLLLPHIIEINKVYKTTYLSIK